MRGPSPVNSQRVEAETQRPVLSRRARLILLTAHIVSISVGLLGDSTGFVAVSIRAANADDPRTIAELAGVLNMFSLVFGIPLSFGAIVTGVGLGLGTRWGVFRYPWVTAKLLLIVSVMVVGGVFIGPAEAQMRNGVSDASTQLIAAGGL